MTSYSVIPVRTEREKKLFIDIPFRLYDSKTHPQWVPPLRVSVQDALDTKRNPFYKNADIQLFIAFDENNNPVGRIAAIENRAHNQFHNDSVGFFGFFESIDNPQVSAALFQAAEQWLRSRGLHSMRGPMNPSTNHECGLLVRGQSQHPTIMTTWNPKYYADLHESAGLTGVKDLVAYWLPTQKIVDLPQKVIDRAEELKRNSQFTFRDFDLKHFDRDLNICFDIYNSAWEHNWGFFPMTREEFTHAAKEMKLLLDPRFAFIMEKNGDPAGFMLALPDFNYIFKRIPNGRLLPFGLPKILFGKRFLKTVRILTLGVKKEYRKGGIFSLFTYESYLRAKKAGLVGGEASWILEDNEDMNRPWKEMGAPLYRRWRIYEKPLARD